VSEHGNLIIGECALDAIRIVAKTVITMSFLEIYMSVVVPVGGSSAQGSKMLVMKESQVMLRQSVSNASWNAPYDHTPLSPPGFVIVEST
jgi:hypothetical protein